MSTEETTKSAADLPARLRRAAGVRSDGEAHLRALAADEIDRLQAHIRGAEIVVARDDDSSAHSRQRYRDRAESALDRWGAWRGFKGSVDLRAAVADALADERERCAKIADEYSTETLPVDPGGVARIIAGRIRECADGK